MAKLTGTVAKNQSAPSGDVTFVYFLPSTVPAQSKIQIGVNLAGIGPDMIEGVGAAAATLMNVQISGVTLRAVLQKAVKLAYDNKYGITSTVNAGDGVDEAFPP